MHETSFVNSTTAYAYDSANQRVYFRNSAGAETLYIYGKDGKKLATYTITGTTGSAINFTFQSENVYFAGKLISAEGNAEAVDAIGSVRWSSAGSGTARTYYPYGAEYTATANDTEKYATYTRDSLTGLDYAMNRYYSSSWGRFVTPDPTRRSVVASNPVTWNKYTYATDDPIDMNDPAGTCQRPAGLSGGQVGVCIGAFIGTPTVPGGNSVVYGLGDNRGPNSDGGTFIEQFQIVFDPATGAVDIVTATGISQAMLCANPDACLTVSNPGTTTQSQFSYYIDQQGNAQVGIATTAVNGFAGLPGGPGPSETIDIALWLTLSPSGTVSVNPGSTYSGYPSLEVFSYQQGKPTNGLFVSEGGVWQLGTWDTPVSGTLGVTLADAVNDAETGDEGTTPNPIVVLRPEEDNN
jgi:RHS repeat-associated protein